MPFDERTIINTIAQYERGIDGVKESYSFAQNPDRINVLPCVLHYSPSFESDPRAHHNVWRNEIVVRSLLYVLPRQSAGGKLSFLENAAIPFGYKWRAQFQTDSVVSAILSAAGAVRGFLKSGTYGAGGEELTHGDIEMVGWVFSWQFINA